MKKLGTNAYRVEWCYDLPLEEDGKSAIVDEAKYRHKIFGNLSAAKAYAREHLPEDKFGAILIHPVTLTDPHADTPYAGIKSEYRWEETGDAIEIS